MAKSTEEDNSAPKAPDKGKIEKQPSEDNNPKDKDEKNVNNLNEGELKALLDEAINYKTPKDREGKSKLFKDLLHQAEETERIARATSAGGSELVRHCNPSARRSNRHHGGAGTGAVGRRKSSRRTASESVRHGGSLDDLAKEELFLVSKNTLMDKQTNRRNATAVSARQREGGSLPCDVNSSVMPTGCQFLEDARKKKAAKDDKEYTAIDMESLETESLLEHDSLAQNYEEERHEVTFVPKFTSRVNLQISGTPVDDPIPFQELDNIESKKPCYDVETLNSRVHSKYNVFIPTYRTSNDEKKVDENGNAVHQNQNTKKKKKVLPAEKNCFIRPAESVEGHRGDIIHDVDKLVEFVEGDDMTAQAGKTNVKSKQWKQHSEEGVPQKKKQRAHSTKGLDVEKSRNELKKSNSLSEISTGNYDFEENENKVVLRTGKSNQNERPKERRSWGTMEPSPFQILSSNTSMENLDASGNWVVTKPKKKSKKRRNSISSGRRQNSPNNKQPQNRALSPDLRAKSTRSVPHSERSNDSSDADSVHSLPIDGLNVPISYADIAKNKDKDKKISPEKPEKIQLKETISKVEITKKLVSEKSLSTPISSPPSIKTSPHEIGIKSNDEETTKITTDSQIETETVFKDAKVNIANSNLPQLPPDVHNIKSFPAMPNPKLAVEKSVAKVVKVNSTPVNKVVTKSNNVLKSNTRNSKVHNDIQNDLTIIHSNEKESIQFNAQMLPPDIPDVRTIEKMHFMNLPSPPTSALTSTSTMVPNNVVINNNCDNNSERTIETSPPPVVILSGVNNNEVPGLVFGFDVNEQLLNDDICENFISRFVAPENFKNSNHNHDKIVNFIGSAWEAIVNQSNGKVQYYREES